MVPRFSLFQNFGNCKLQYQSLLPVTRSRERDDGVTSFPVNEAQAFNTNSSELD